MEEEWKVITEFPIYSVSNLGRIRNDKRNYILTGGFDRDGYRQVTICYENKQYTRRICRLVAKEFIANPNNYPCVNHIDENKENDVVTNLEWCTVKYNNNYGSKNDSKRMKIKCVETNIVYDSLRIAEKKLGYAHENLSQAAKTGCIRYGYHWEFV